MGRKPSTLVLDASLVELLIESGSVPTCLRQGSRWVMPALAYLDVLARCRRRGVEAKVTARMIDTLGIGVAPLNEAGVLELEAVRCALADDHSMDDAMICVVVTADSAKCAIATAREESYAPLRAFIAGSSIQILVAGR